MTVRLIPSSFLTVYAQRHTVAPDTRPTTMVALSYENRTQEINLTSDVNRNGNDGQETQKKVLGYEQCREERIKENMERMQKLGILDLSLKLKSFKPNPRTRKTPHQQFSPLPPSVPTRRSSRLQNATPVSYSEVCLTRKDKSVEFAAGLDRDMGSKPEVYTEEHEKLLGNTERSWTLFVDGYGKDGRRIYDPVKGKTCHQCRQKTLGHRTLCSKCNMVQGQFCGDCLYMRYGEHVLEANQNPNWICPVCRGICNCSLCRQAKGWAPTGALYRKISSLGFKSVAHYLIQTRRAVPDEKVIIKEPVSAKRSLAFSDMESASADQKFSEPNDEPENMENDQSEAVKTDDDPVSEQKDSNFSNNENCHRKVLLEGLQQSILESTVGIDSCNEVQASPDGSHVALESVNRSSPATQSCDDSKGSLKPEPEDKQINDTSEGKKEVKEHLARNKHSDSSLAPETSKKSNRKQIRNTEPSLDGIAGRLRSRGGKEHEKLQSNGGTPDVKPSNGKPCLDKTDEAICFSGNRCSDSILAPKTTPISNRKRTGSSEPNPDSIAGRLKLRRANIITH